MAITITDSAQYPNSWSVGQVKFQILDYVVNSGATSGTVSPDAIPTLWHVLFLGGKMSHSAAPTYSGGTATIACVVPAETKASRVINGLTYTAVANLGAGGNSVTITVVDGSGDMVPVTNGNEVVTVSGTAITVRIDPTAVTGSTRTNVRIAVNANAAAAALVLVTGTSATIASTSTVLPLQSGVTGGARGSVLCIGRA